MSNYLECHSSNDVITQKFSFMKRCRSTNVLGHSRRDSRQKWISCFGMQPLLWADKKMKTFNWLHFFGDAFMSWRACFRARPQKAVSQGGHNLRCVPPRALVTPNFRNVTCILHSVISSEKKLLLSGPFIEIRGYPIQEGRFLLSLLSCVLWGVKWRSWGRF